MQGVFVWQGQGELYEILQFYPDGLVLSAHIQISDLAAAWNRIAGWFQPGTPNRYVAQGRYLVQAKTLSFRVVSPFATVEYNGTRLDSDCLQLRLTTGSGATLERSYRPLPLAHAAASAMLDKP